MTCNLHRWLPGLLVAASACVFSDDFDRFRESEKERFVVEAGPALDDGASPPQPDAATADGSYPAPPVVPAPDEDGGGALEAGGGGISDGGGTPVARCTNGATQNCSCAPFRSGKQSCSAGTWQACNCDPGDCVVGDYRGSFVGQLQYPIIGIYTIAAPPGAPPSLRFTLQPPAASGQPYLVHDGAFSSVISDSVTWKGTLSGSLDCNTKRFTGRLEAKVESVNTLGGSGGLLGGGLDAGGASDAAVRDAGPLVLQIPASASVTATYNADTRSFASGTWKADNPDASSLLVPSGNGTWSSEFAGGAP